MPYQPDQVQVFDRQGGGEKLIRTNYYKRFERKVDGDLESYNAQGGAWWSNGGDRIKDDEIPDWVWTEVRAMDSGYRRMYRILTPEERRSGEVMPPVEVAPEWPTATDIYVALGKLDPASDLDWDEDGKPKLLALKRILKTYITRKKLDSIAPDFVRPYLETSED